MIVLDAVRLDGRKLSATVLFGGMLALAGCGGSAGNPGGSPGGGANGSEGAAQSLGSAYPDPLAGTPGAADEPVLMGRDAPDGGSGGISEVEPDRPTSSRDAARLLAQASFGATRTALAQVKAMGARKYLLAQMDAPVSQYVYTTTEAWDKARVHTHATPEGFCQTYMAEHMGECWRDYYSAHPVQREFFRQAVSNPDQLRQRMAFALGQILVTSARELDTSYGFAHYHQLLRDHAFGNYRTVLEKVTLSPFMGTYLNMVNNDRAEPNENYARELLQLFSLGTCQLDMDGSLAGNTCIETYDNERVRNYAFALTGWTYPPGGNDPWCGGNCQGWTNPRYYRGSMVARNDQHDGEARKLLSGVTAPAGRTAAQGLNAVLDSLMAHPNMAPFIGRQLIQFFVTSNPSRDYVRRVAQAFATGLYSDGSGPAIGTGQRGDLRATISAVLLDPEARSDVAADASHFGRLREPAQIIAGALRALEGYTDGDAVGAEWAWAGMMGQPAFTAPSVFNFYPPDFPLTGTSLVAPQMGSESLTTALARINYGNALLYWWGERGVEPNVTITEARGTRINLVDWERMITGPGDSARALDEIDMLLLGGRLDGADRAAIITAMDAWTPDMSWLENYHSNWRKERMKTAFYLVMASPRYQIQR